MTSDLGIRLRRPRVEDWVHIHEFSVDERVYRFQVWGPNSPDESRSFMEAAVACWQTPPAEQVRWYWLAEHAQCGVVGAGDLWLRDRHRQAEIGYLVHPDHWRCGYATWIATEMVRFGFEELHLHPICATCDPRNAASGAVLRKVGMVYEGRARHTLLLRDGWRDSEMYSILESEFAVQ